VTNVWFQRSLASSFRIVGWWLSTHDATAQSFFWLAASSMVVLGLLVVGLLTGTVAERFTRNKQPDDDDVVRRLDELAARLERIESGLGHGNGRN